jgi:hypothetical protein
VRPRHGQRTQHDGVDNGEDRRIGADAQGEREDGDRGEGRRVAQGAGGVAQIAPQVLGGGFPADVAGVVFQRGETAHLGSGGARGLFTRQTGLHLLLDRRLEVPAQLGIELAVPFAAAEQRTQAAGQTFHRTHHNSPREASRILAIAVVCTSHSRVPRLSAVRPADVSE